MGMWMGTLYVSKKSAKCVGRVLWGLGEGGPGLSGS